MSCHSLTLVRLHHTWKIVTKMLFEQTRGNCFFMAVYWLLAVIAIACHLPSVFFLHTMSQNMIFVLESKPNGSIVMRVCCVSEIEMTTGTQRE